MRKRGCAEDEVDVDGAGQLPSLSLSLSIGVASALHSLNVPARKTWWASGALQEKCIALVAELVFDMRESAPGRLKWATVTRMLLSASSS